MSNVLGSGGGGQTSTSVTTQELSPEQKRLLDLVIPEAEKIIGSPPQLFPGSTIAPRDPLQLQAQQRVLELVGAGGPPAIPSAGAGGIQINPGVNFLPSGGATPNPEIARIQALIGQLPPTVEQTTNPEFTRLTAALQSAEQQFPNVSIPGGGPGSQLRQGEEGSGVSPARTITDPRVTSARQALQGVDEFTGGGANPALEILQRQLAGTPSTISGPAGGGGVPGGGGAPGGGQVGQFVNAAVGGGQFLAGGDVLFPESNPALRAATDAAIRPLTENFLETILPGIRGEAITSGGLGGSRQGIAEGQASRGLLRQIGDTSASIQANAFQQSLDAMVKALFAAPQTAQLPFVGPAAIEAVGAQRQQFAQAQLSEQAQRFLSEQLIPFATAQDVAALAFGIPGGKVTSTATLPGQNNALGDILGVLGLGATLFGGFGGAGFDFAGGGGTITL